MKQELGVHKSVLGNIDTLPTNTANIIGAVSDVQTDNSADNRSRASLTPTKKHPPTKLYIEDDSNKKVETFVRWKQSQMERELRDKSVVDDTKHLSELEKQIELVQQSSEPPVLPQSQPEEKSSKKKEKKSFSSIFSAFTKKKSSARTPEPSKKKSSLSQMMEKEGTASILDPTAQQKIIEKATSETSEPDRAKTPYQLWRLQRENTTQGHVGEGTVPAENMFIRTPTPDPDYDNLSFKSSSPRAPRDSPRAPREHHSFDDNSSDTSFEDYGRYTPRSNASEYGKNIQRYQPLPNLITGYGRGRGISPANSDIGVATPKRSPSTESFFGKNGASVAQTSNSQIWYQKYKHSSFSHPYQNSFGEQLYGAFDGRISKFRGKIDGISRGMFNIF